jgi:MraZ protein
MFLNQYHHSFDDKGRLTIPAKFRELPDEGLFVVQGLDRNLMVLPPAFFDKLYKHLVEMNLTDPAARQLRQIMFSNAQQVYPDGSGRILIPQNLRALAELKDEVVFVGQGDHYDIWAVEQWQKQQILLNDPETNAQRFNALDLSLR